MIRAGELKEKVLVITYYWPPSGGSGVQRWLKFVKYLPSFGWKPYVFTPRNPSFSIKDESLLKDVPPEAVIIPTSIWEPYSIFNRLSREKTNSANSTPRPTSFFKKISIWIRGNIFVPDPRVFWVRPSVRFLNQFLATNHISTIITTGPPHSVHLIGLGLKKKNPSLKWIADFRDPWSEWFFLETIKVGRLARYIHNRLEKKVLQRATRVLTITPFYVKQFERLGNRSVDLLTNGFDEDDFRDFTVKRPEKFVIRHVGTVVDRCEIIPFMDTIATLCKSHLDFAEDIQIDFVGEVNSTFKNYIENHPFLKTITTFTPTVPHKQVINAYSSSSLLLLVLIGYKDAEGYMPGKLFEYIATGLPILGLGPEKGDAASLLERTNQGRMIDSINTNHIVDQLLGEYQNWKNNPSIEKVSQPLLTRRELTKQLSELLIRTKF